MSNPATQFTSERQPETPGGRPKGSKSFTTKVREALEKIYEGTDIPADRALVDAILKNAIKKGDVQAQKMIWNYLDGMPVAKTELSGELKTSAALPMTPEIAKLAEEYEAKILEQLKKSNA